MTQIESIIAKTYAKNNTLYVHPKTAQALELYDKDDISYTQIFNREYKVVIISQTEQQHIASVNNYTPIPSEHTQEEIG